MPGPDRRPPHRRSGPPDRRSARPQVTNPLMARGVHPGRGGRSTPPAVPADADAEPIADAEAASTAETTAAAAKQRPLDGEGRPYVTLAQFLKWQSLVPTGGAAKALVRSGTIQVNGQVEDRPGRKLHQDDRVTIEGQEHPVVLDPM